MTPARVIIDTDPGVDDFLALVLALASPELRIEAVTTVGGNAALRHTNANALRILEALGRTDIPVHRGAARPLRGSFGSAEDVHGAGGLPIRLPGPRTRPRRPGAVDLIGERLRAPRRQPLTLIALGPLTNVARLLGRYPDEARRLRRIAVMGGAVNTPGNVTPAAEFNIWSDPEAADAVFRSGIPVTLVGLDVTRQVRVGADEAALANTPVVRRLLQAQARNRPEGLITLHDPLTVMAVISPGVVTLEAVRIAVDTGDGPDRGRVRRDPAGPEIDLAVSVDVPAARRLFRERVLAPAFTPAPLPPTL